MDGAVDVLGRRGRPGRRSGAGALLLAVALVVGLAPAPPAGAAGEPEVIVVGSTTTVRPEQRPAELGGSRGAALVAARNEFESFQVVVAAGDAPLRGLAVAPAEPLTRADGVAIPASNVTIYRAGYYDAQGVRSDAEGGLGRWPDPLIPVTDVLYGEQRNAFSHPGFSLDVPALENRVAWIDVLVPKTQPPGVYRGALRVSAGGLDVTVPMRVSVVDLELPSEPSLRSAVNLTHRKVCQGHHGGNACPTPEEQWRLHADYARIGLDNRLSLDNVAPGTPDNAVTLDRFRRHILPLYLGTSDARLPGARLSPMMLYPWCDSGCLAAWRAEAERSGFLDRVAYYACDEPNNSQREWDEICGPNIDRARSAWGSPRLPVAVTATIQDAADAGYADQIDILMPLVNYLHDRTGSIRAGGRFIGDQRPAYDAWLSGRTGRELWTYQACFSHGCEASPPVDGRCAPHASEDPYWNGWPSLVIDQPASQHRAAGWVGYAYRTTGEYYYESVYSLWQTGDTTGPARTDAWAEQYCFGGHGDGTLYYPGTPARIGGSTHIPIESIRMKRYRDGREDYELLLAAGAGGHGAEARDIARELMPTAYETTVTHAQIDAARLDVLALAGIEVPLDGGAPLERLGGRDRFATAAVIARDAFTDADTVVVARGENFPDALAGSYLAAQLDAPILLSTVDAVPTVTMEAIRALGARRAVLLGGTAALGEGVVAQLRAAGLEVERIGGRDRFGTALGIATHAGPEGVGSLPGGGRSAILASGAKFPDALVAGPISFASRIPTLLTGKDTLHPSVREAIEVLGLEQIVIVGGDGVVGLAVQAELEGMGLRVRRLSGRDRWATAAVIADFVYDELQLGNGYVHVARGDDFPDALAGGPHAGRGARRGPIMLTASDHVEPATCALLEERSSTLVGGSVYGGAAAVSEGTKIGLEQCASADPLMEAPPESEPPPRAPPAEPEPDPSPAAAPPPSTALALTSADGVLGPGDRLTVTFDTALQVADGHVIDVIDPHGDEARLTCGGNARCSVTGSGQDHLVVDVDAAPESLLARSNGTIEVSDHVVIVGGTMGNAAGPWNVPGSGIPTRQRVFGLSSPSNTALHPAVQAADVTVDTASRVLSVRDEGCTSLPDYATVYVHGADGALLSGGVEGNPDVVLDGTACTVDVPLREPVASGDTLLILYRVAGPFTPSATLAYTIP